MVSLDKCSSRESLHSLKLANIDDRISPRPLELPFSHGGDLV